MSSFKELIKTGKVKTAWHKKQALVGSIQDQLTEIGSLDTNTPNVRIFARTHEGAIALLDELVQASRELKLTLFEQNPAIYTDVDYRADTQSDVALRLTLRSDLDRYIEVMSTKNIQFPPAVDPAAPVAENVDLTQILNALVKSQTDNAAASNAQQLAVAQQHKETLETLQKHGQAGPKASQPFFTPKNSDADYEIYSEFIQRFKNFVIKCTDEVKLQWLQSSVKSDALLLIKHLSPSNANYAIALERLEKRFNNPEVIKHNLVQSILNFKADSNPRYTKVVSAITGFANALEELKTKHNIDDDKKMLEEYNREILFYNLPAPIRKGLITLTGNNFPTSEQILKRYEEVVTRLNLTEGAKQNKVITKEKVITSGAQANDVSTFNVAHKKGKQASETKCLFCGGNHRSQICEKVKDIKTRENAIKTKHPRLCFKCGYNKHPNYNKCFYKTLCHDKDCSGSPKHGRLYCPKFCKGVNNHQINQVSSIPALVHAVGQESKSVALPTGIFFVKDKHAEKLPVEERNLRALLDSAAQKTLISKAAVERLNLKVDSSEKACLLGYGNKRPTNNIFNIVRVLLGLPYSDKKVSVEAYVVDKLNAVHMLGIAKVAKRIQSKGVTIADWMLINTKADIVNFDILVGADHFWKLVNPYKLPIERMGMMLTPDRWGRYLIMGKIPGSSKIPKHQSVNYISINQVGYDQSDLRSHLRAQSQILDANEYVDDSNAFSISRELNSYDALGFQVSSRAENDTEALEAYNSNMYKNEETNQYIVGFPWVNNKAPNMEELESNYGIVYARFRDTMKFLDKDPEKRKQYKETHDKEAAMDFIEEVPLNEIEDERVFKHYINHFPVFKQESATTKCRRVFDASLHRRGRESLNDRMWKGSLMTPHILDVLLRIRLLKFLFTLDISKAFLRMVLKQSDRNYTCFFFRRDIDDPNSPIVLWRFKSVLFGATSSPFLLNCTIADILGSNEFSFPLEVFVDNLFVQDQKENVMIRAAEELITIFDQAAMPLHEFASNSSSANEYFRSRKLVTNESKIKLLGMLWDYNNDQLFVKQPEFDTETVTKRILLSNIARVFDPIGFLNPIAIQGRLLVQEAMECSYVWDAKLPIEFEIKWREIVDLFREALVVPIPRWIGFDIYSRLSLHAFTDSSNKALGAVVYLANPKGRVFISSKGKVCPIKMAHFTVPRKELTALALGTRHLLFVNRALSKYITIESLHIWSDSTLSLTWCSVKKPHKELFIRARVDDVQEKVEKNNIKLHYIINSSNPADMLTKNTGKKIIDPLWIKGPELLQSPHMWHPYVPNKAAVDAIPLFCGITTVQEVSDLFPSAETFTTLKELYAKTVESHPDIVVRGDKATILAEQFWIKHIQQIHFADIIKFLRELEGNNLRSIEGKKLVRDKTLEAPSLCLNLHLKLDPQGIIRIKTSLGNCPNLTKDQKFPILLPTNSPFTKLVILHNHIQSGHMTIHYTRAKLRNRFWIPKDTGPIKAVLSNCMVCKAERGRRYHVPDSPDLPSDRFDISAPWKVTHLDMTGHFFVKDRYDNADKIYLIVFVCAATGAGHIEVAMQASAEAFANAFERFCAKNGVPEKLLSDHGSNFMAFSKELNMNPGEISLNRYLVNKKICWEFLPIGDPHFNGYCERALGVLKSIMRKGVGKKLLTLDQLMTVASYAQAVFNERPLCVMEGGDANIVPLTPNSIILGRNLRQFVHNESDCHETDQDFVPTSKKCFEMNKKLRATLASVQKHWVSEYLGFLSRKDAARQKNSPHTKSLLIPEVNDWVIVRDNDRDIRIAKILELLKSDDGEIRKVLLQVNNTQGIYPITNLRFLEAGKDNDISGSNNTNSEIGENVSKPVRPLRQAAKVALTKIKECNK